MSSISVVVPIYQSEDTIDACIESILQQSMDDFELILVDDGCTDKSGDICDRRAATDRRLKVIHQENKGRSVARAVGVEAATGEWICFVDSDDQLPITALSLLLAKADDTTDIVFGNGHTLPSDESRTVIPIDEFRHLAVRAEGTIGTPWGSLYRRSVLTPWMFDVPRHIYNGEDYLFWLRLIFTTDRPVNIVYEQVYDKGAEHTSNSFIWTADYCYELNELRKASIPVSQHDKYLSDMLDDRLENLFATTLCTKRNEWLNSTFYRDIKSDMDKCGRKLSLKQRLFLHLPSQWLRKHFSEIVRFILVGLMATVIHYIIYYVFLSLTGHNLAYTIGYVISFGANFILSSLFTFKVSLSFNRLAGFSISHLLNYLIQIILLNIFIWLGISKVIAPLPVFIIAVPVNYLMVRFALKREQHAGDGFKLFLMLAGIAMLWLFLLEAPTLSDDMVYRFMFQADLDATCKPIQSVGDLIQSQIAHYQLLNGRAVIHTVAQTMLILFPLWVCAVLNTLLFVILIWQVVRWVNCPSHNLFVSVMVCFLLFVVVADIRTTILWTMGAFNYLWVLVATMTLLLWLRHIKEKPLSTNHVLLSSLAFLVGWSHEGLSLPLSIAFIYYLLLNRRTVFRRAVWPYMFFYVLGTLMLLLSPALWNRASEGVTMISRVVSGVTNYLFNVRIVWLLALALIVLCWKNIRKREMTGFQTIKQEFHRHQYIYLALMVSMGIVFLCGTNLPRVPFFADFLAMLLLVRLLTEMIHGVWQRRFIIGACVVMLLFYIPVVLVRQENKDVWNNMERQMATSGQELISVPQPTENKNLLCEYFRNHYVNPSAEFGFFNVYQAFDSNDINMRCAASLFGKERLVFLPEDVVERIKTDSTAYVNYELDQNGNLYIWRVADGTTVKHLVFVLNEEDYSSLWPHQRLMAYKGDTYELDDFHYEVVTVYGHSYLVFTCPTSNISRRINHIEYD